MGGNKCLNHKAYVKQIQAGHTTWCVKVIMVVPAGFSQWLLSCGLWLHTWQQSNLLAWNTVATVAISNTKLLQVKLSGRKSARAYEYCTRYSYAAPSWYLPQSGEPKPSLPSSLNTTSTQLAALLSQPSSKQKSPSDGI